MTTTADMIAARQKTEARNMQAINAFLKSRPGLFGPRTTATKCWQEAYRAAGLSCGFSLFRWHLRRLGYDIGPGSSGHVLDLSDATLVEEA